jgi:putative transposase
MPSTSSAIAGTGSQRRSSATRSGYYRFAISFRDVEDLLARRGITVSYESIRHWCETFGSAYARRLRRRAGPVGDTWHLDETFVRIRGQRQHLWRAVDQNGEVIDILLQPRRDRQAAARFLRRLLKRSGRVPRRLVTDRLRSYRAAHRTVMPSVLHDTRRYANNLAEVSHQPTRRRERAMRGFKSGPQAQRFLTVHGVVRSLFAVGRLRLRARHQRQLRSRAFETWNAVVAT